MASTALFSLRMLASSPGLRRAQQLTAQPSFPIFAVACRHCIAPVPGGVPKLFRPGAGATKEIARVIRDDYAIRAAVAVIDDLLVQAQTESCTLCGILSLEQIIAIKTLRRAVGADEPTPVEAGRNCAALRQAWQQRMESLSL